MTLRDTTASVLALQLHYSSANTPEMAQRGQLIRSGIPGQLSAEHAELAAAANIAVSDLIIEGRDGVGRKSEIPWVRFASRRQSPSATTGWYVVWLYRRDGAGVYLALAHGSTQFLGGSLVARSDKDLARLMVWSRAALMQELSGLPTLTYDITLASTAALALAYEKSCVAAFYYPAESLPDEATLKQGMLTMAALLGRLHEAERLGLTPLSANPEIRDAQEATNDIARPGSARDGQGFSMSAAERRVIESWAMEMASQYLREIGFQIRDVSAGESFDLLAERNAETIKVEVKGTTGGLGAILLTLNEVELHRQAYPNNALIVVHSIELTTRNALSSAKGGVLKTWMPWALDENRLRGVTYMYQLTDS